jgi:membrane associated rhomboid family serine protease
LSEIRDDRDNFCYRHPDRQSYILCQRCGRTICPQCSTQAAVGVHCPECVKEAKANAPKRQPARVRFARSLTSRSDRPVVTYAIIAICVVVYLAQLLLGNALTNWLVYYAPLSFSQPWRFITSLVAHGSPLHLLSNMFSLYIIGRMLEPALGRMRYLALFLISGIGGAVAVALLVPGNPVLGASGAIFGMLGALLVLIRRFGGNATQILVVVGINLVIGFVLPGVSWQAHIGGFVAGAALTAVFVRTRSVKQRGLQVAASVGIALALLAIIAVRLGI